MLADVKTIKICVYNVLYGTYYVCKVIIIIFYSSERGKENKIRDTNISVAATAAVEEKTRFFFV